MGGYRLYKMKMPSGRFCKLADCHSALRELRLKSPETCNMYSDCIKSKTNRDLDQEVYGYIACYSRFHCMACKHGVPQKYLAYGELYSFAHNICLFNMYRAYKGIQLP